MYFIQHLSGPLKWPGLFRISGNTNGQSQQDTTADTLEIGQSQHGTTGDTPETDVSPEI